MQELAKPEFVLNNYGVGLAKAYSKLCDTIGTEYNVTLTHSLGVALPESTTAPISHRNGYIGTLTIIVFVIIDLLFNRGRIFLLFYKCSFGITSITEVVLEEVVVVEALAALVVAPQMVEVLLVIGE